MRKNTLSQVEAVQSLYRGFILQNEHGFTVRLLKGKQVKTNKKRKKVERDYKFDYPTWKIVGRISLYQRVLNSLELLR